MGHDTRAAFVGVLRLGLGADEIKRPGVKADSGVVDVNIARACQQVSNDSNYARVFAALKASADESQTPIVFTGAAAAITWSRVRDGRCGFGHRQPC
jgi:hypothetical protein